MPPAFARGILRDGSLLFFSSTTARAETWSNRMTFAIKAEVRDSGTRTFTFRAQKTMYGGKRIAAGDTIFVFASENEGGAGLIVRGIVSAAEAVARKPGIARQTPRV